MSKKLEIIDLLEKGVAIVDVIRITGACRTYVYNLAKDLGIDKHTVVFLDFKGLLRRGKWK